ARKSARCFLKANRQEEAVRQHLLAAKIWINYTAFADTLANYDLEKAQEIATQTSNFALLAQVYLLQAQYSILRGNKSRMQKMWQQVEELLPKVHPDTYIALATELAIQKSVVARLDEEWEMAKNLLEAASHRDWPPQQNAKRLEVLWSLLFLYSEIGDWQSVDRVYGDAQKHLDKQNQSQTATWAAHYAASLARRGEPDKAFEVYVSVIDFFKSENAVPHQKQRFFQNMLYTLFRHAGHKTYSPMLKYDSERMDLALTVLHDDVGHLYRESARRYYMQNNTEIAFAHAQNALMYAWRKGDWSGLSEAKKVLAAIYYAEGDYVSAVFAAIGHEQYKTLETYAIHLRELVEPEKIQQVFNGLLREWSTRVDLENALVVLSKCADLVPPNRLDEAIEFTITVQQEYLASEMADLICRPSIQFLRSLAPQFDRIQIQRVVEFGITTLDLQVHWTIKDEIVQLLSDCFENQSAIKSELFEPAMNAVLPFYRSETALIRNNAGVALLYIALNAPAHVRSPIAALFKENAHWDYLAILKEPISKEIIQTHVESILQAITPRKDNGGISYNGRNAQSINNFNDYMTPSLGNLTVDGLLQAVKNPDGFLNQKSSAILALKWLPDSVLAGRANEIGLLLLSVLNGEFINSEEDGFARWLGDKETILRNSLYTLGHLYFFVRSPIKKQIHGQLLSLSTSQFSIIRMGTAMAFRVLNSASFSNEFVLVLVELMRDQDSGVRHWAAAAAGHRIVDGDISKATSKFVTQRLLNMACEDKSVHARAGAAYGLRILLESDVLSGSLKTQAQQIREKVLTDVNYQVRRLISTQIGV
ncbi:MAG TPA: hypothetical protein P5280_12340, partial [Cyclobacteriaceae bacterium]|nr:hypothetical protein [Cyclobacteriaceae bacterium]